MVILIWDDNAYGLISWKMDLEIGHNVDTHSGIPTSSPMPRASARRATGSRRPTNCCRQLRAALADDTVSVIACPVDYSANSALIASLGELDESLS